MKTTEAMHQNVIRGCWIRLTFLIVKLSEGRKLWGIQLLEKRNIKYSEKLWNKNHHRSNSSNIYIQKSNYTWNLNFVNSVRCNSFDKWIWCCTGETILNNCSEHDSIYFGGHINWNFCFCICFPIAFLYTKGKKHWCEITARMICSN